MKANDYKTHHKNLPQETDTNFEIATEPSSTIGVEEEYVGDAYNFFPDAAF